MRLKVMIPERVLIEQEAEKIIARGKDGYFCLLPRHVDFVSVLEPGILSYGAMGGEAAHAAIDQGTLVKCGDEVLISTRHACQGDDIDELGRIIAENYLAESQAEALARRVIEEWEAEFSPLYLKAG